MITEVAVGFMYTVVWKKFSLAYISMSRKLTTDWQACVNLRVRPYSSLEKWFIRSIALSVPFHATKRSSTYLEYNKKLVERLWLSFNSISLITNYAKTPAIRLPIGTPCRCLWKTPLNSKYDSWQTRYDISRKRAGSCCSIGVCSNKNL